MTGHPEAGRAEYQKALAIFDKYTNFDEYTKKSTHIKSELSWAYSEFSARTGTQLFEQHLKNAEDFLADLLPSPGREQLEAEINQAKQQLHSTHALNPLGR